MKYKPADEDKTPSEQLSEATVRIVCGLADGSTSTGTGFFFNLHSFPDKSQIPVIVTNRHVVAGAVTGEIQFTGIDKQSTRNLRLMAKYKERYEKIWIPHPEPDVDLCVCPIGGEIQMMHRGGMPPSFTQLDASLIPSDEEMAQITAAEDVLMIGYPNGLWDEYNNMPIVRKGITATHPYLDYNQREEFLIDIACYPGSSGSPVLLYNPNGFYFRGQGIVRGPRLKLLGVVYAMAIHKTLGEIEVVTIPTQQKQVAVSDIPNNLGFVIRANKILDFVPILIERAEKLRQQIHDSQANPESAVFAAQSDT